MLYVPSLSVTAEAISFPSGDVTSTVTPTAGAEGGAPGRSTGIIGARVTVPDKAPVEAVSPALIAREVHAMHHSAGTIRATRMRRPVLSAQTISHYIAKIFIPKCILSTTS